MRGRLIIEDTKSTSFIPILFNEVIEFSDDNQVLETVKKWCLENGYNEEDTWWEVTQ